MKLPLIAFFVLVCCAFATVDLKPVDSDDAVKFSIKNFGIGTGGELKGLRGLIKWDAANPAASSINVSVDVSTINTGIDSRDNHLKKEEYFNVAKYPVISFVSESVSAENGSLQATGNITIKGVSKRITIPFTVSASDNGYLFSGNFTVNRRDFGVGGGSMVLGDEVKIALKVKANP